MAKNFRHIEHEGLADPKRRANVEREKAQMLDSTWHEVRVIHERDEDTWTATSQRFRPGRSWQTPSRWPAVWPRRMSLRFRSDRRRTQAFRSGAARRDDPRTNNPRQSGPEGPDGGK